MLHETKMMLHETRIVLIEKNGQGKVLNILSLIDENIKLGVSNYIGNIYFPDIWLEDKLIKKVLEANGYGIYKDTRSGRNSTSYIRHNGYK